MTIFEVIFIAISVAMDAFAVSVCLGLKLKAATFKKALIIGGYFGLFQALMPLIGFFFATLFASYITAFDHWIAFGLLSLLGVRMLLGSFKKDETGCTDRECPESTCSDRQCPGRREDVSLRPSKMLPLSIATSIDALAVGISFAFMEVEIFSAIGIIGLITLSFCMIGVKIGNSFGNKIKSKAELVGGIILILIGIKVLIEHLLSA